jgi:hypothetical protein
MWSDEHTARVKRANNAALALRSAVRGAKPESASDLMMEGCDARLKLVAVMHVLW